MGSMNVRLLLVPAVLWVAASEPAVSTASPQVSGWIASAVVDVAGGHAYLRLRGTKRAAKVALGEPDGPPRVVGMVREGSAEFKQASGRALRLQSFSARKGAFDPTRDCTYRIELRPGRITKRNGRTLRGQLIGSVPVPKGPGSLRAGGCILIDSACGVLCVGTARGPQDPGQVLKVAMGEEGEPPRLIGSLLLAEGEANPSCGVLDAASGYAYLGSDSRIVKVALGGEGEPPVRVDALSLNAEESDPRSGVIDAARGCAYFWNARSFVKVGLGEGVLGPTRLGAIRAEPSHVRQVALTVLIVGAIIAVPVVLSLLFSFPLSRTIHRYGDYACGRLPPDEGELAGAAARRALWRGLRWWALFWTVAALTIICLAYPEYHGSGVTPDVGASGRFAYAVASMLLFYCPLPYILAACLLAAPRCRRWRSLFLWTHFGGLAGCALALVAVVIGLGTVLQFMDFRLPSGAYNPGFPEPHSTVVYATALGAAVAVLSWPRFRRWCNRSAAVKAGESEEHRAG